MSFNGWGPPGDEWDLRGNEPSEFPWWVRLLLLLLSLIVLCAILAAF